MPQYTYVAMDGAAKQRKGKLNAANKTAAEAELRAKGLFPIEIKEIIQR